MTQTAPGILSTAEPLPGLEGDLLLLAEPLDAPVEGGEAGMLAGQPGMDFGRVLADAQGRWPVPHHRAVDVLRDNRLLPYGSDARTWRFTLPEGCGSPSASATLLYRAYPPALARERSWPSLDHVMGSLDLAPD